MRIGKDYMPPISVTQSSLNDLAVWVRLACTERCSSRSLTSPSITTVDVLWPRTTWRKNRKKQAFKMLVTMLTVMYMLVRAGEQVRQLIRLHLHAFVANRQHTSQKPFSWLRFLSLFRMPDEWTVTKMLDGQIRWKDSTEDNITIRFKQILFSLTTWKRESAL